MVKTSNNLIIRVNQHLPKTHLNKIKSCKKEKKFDILEIINSSSAIGQHLITNLKCFESYKVDNFKIISVARNEFHLKTLEAIYILSLKPEISVNKRNLFIRTFSLIR